MHAQLTTSQLVAMEQQLHSLQEELRSKILRSLNELGVDEYITMSQRLANQPEDCDWGTLLRASGWSKQDKNLERLLKVEASLALFDQEMFGLCADCESEIEVKRLLADPATQRCYGCEQRYQSRDRSREHNIL